MAARPFRMPASPRGSHPFDQVSYYDGSIVPLGRQRCSRGFPAGAGSRVGAAALARRLLSSSHRRNSVIPSWAQARGRVVGCGRGPGPRRGLRPQRVGRRRRPRCAAVRRGHAWRVTRVSGRADADLDADLGVDFKDFATSCRLGRGPGGFRPISAAIRRSATMGAQSPVIAEDASRGRRQHRGEVAASWVGLSNRGDWI